MKEYLVTVKDPAEFDVLHTELLEDRIPGHYLSQKSRNADISVEHIPDRPVKLINYRPGSLRTAHYHLTDAEAVDLRLDPRVLSVEPHIKHTPNVKVIKFAQQSGVFDKSSSVNNSFLNWGLKSSSSDVNPFGTATQLISTYPYVLDAEHVDIIMVDSGIIPDHPEFAVNPDGTGGSRVKQIDWYAETGIPGTMPPNHYRDEDGHGTHCAGISAGNTQGWAKKANIYSIKAITDFGINAVDIYDVFDLIRIWHTNKPINPRTGRPNPTIVNNSWGFLSSSGNITEFNYRNNVHSAANFNTAQRAAYGLVNYSFYYGGNVHGVRVSSIDAEIADCIAAGVIIVGAAGNYFHKVDVPGGVDYDNYYLDFFGGNYYHRGATPSATPGVICVGNIDSVYPEQKNTSSECGPRVDIYAAGTRIMSSYRSGVSDARSNGHYLAKLSGTSMASPQVVGAIALVLQFKPWLTPAQAVTMLTNISANNRISDIGAVSYTNYRSLQGSANKYLYMQYTGGDAGESMSMTVTTNIT